MDPSVLQKSVAKFGLELHPSKVQNVMEGVREQLDAQLLRYVDELQGVLMAYSNVRILTKEPLIHPYFPYFHLDVQAEVLLFKPTPGCSLVGKVIQVGLDFLGLLVLGVFNASIPRDRVRKEFKHVDGEHAWASSKDSSHRLELEGQVVFTVDTAQAYGSYYGITGALMEPHTGALDHVRKAQGLGPAPLAVAKPAAGGFAALLAGAVGEAVEAADASQGDGKKKKSKKDKKDQDKDASSAKEDGVGNGPSTSGKDDVQPAAKEASRKDKKKDKEGSKKGKSASAASAPSGQPQQQHQQQAAAVTAVPNGKHSEPQETPGTSSKKNKKKDKDKKQDKKRQRQDGDDSSDDDDDADKDKKKKDKKKKDKKKSRTDSDS